ncbi:MAG: tetratricopeptide repeat protein [Nitrospinales bacterium]
MKTLKRSIIIFFFACSFVAGPDSPAQATFPDMEIGHWGKMDTNIPSMAKGLTNDRDDPQYIKVHELVRDKKYDEALAILEEKAKNKSERDTALILKAIILNEQGKYLQALSVMRLGEVIQKLHPAIQFGLCQIHRNLGQADMARRSCRITTQQHFRNPLTHYEFAQTLMALGEMKEASDELALAAQFDPKNPRYHYQRGLIFSYFNDTDQAKRAFQKALSADPNHLDSVYQLAYIYAVTGKPEKAKKQIAVILAAKDEHPKTQSAKVLLNYINENATAKLPAKIDPPAYHLSRSQSFYKSGKYGLALLEVQTAARLKPDDLKTQEILVGLSSILLRLVLAEEAVNHLIELAKGQSVLQARGYQKLGDIKVMQGKLAAARKNYEKALSLGDPKNLAKIAIEEIPEQSADSAAPIKPQELYIDPVEGLNRQGEIFSHYGMYKSALGIYSLILKMKPTHVLAKLNAGAAYFKIGQYNRAIALLEKVLVTHPNHENISTHRLLLAQAYAKKGDLTSALNNLEKLVELNPRYKKLIQSKSEFEKLKNFERYKKLMQ